MPPVPFLPARAAQLVTPRIFTRGEATARRLTKKLRQHPHPSFNLTSTSPSGSHIIHNPPSAAPNPLITPSLFLPQSDPRRQILQSSTSAAAEPKHLPPMLSVPKERTYHLTEKDFTEIRELRQKAPFEWTANKLAKKYNVSPLVIGIAAPAGKDVWQKREKELDTVKAKWGRKRSEARVERQRRRALWGTGEGVSVKGGWAMQAEKKLLGIN